VQCAPPRETVPAGLAGDLSPLAPKRLLCAGSDDAPLMVSFDAEAVLRMVDRTFGGKGEVASPLPEVLPLSCELMIGRLETIFAERLSRVMGAVEADEIRPQGRDCSPSQLVPSTGTCQLAVLTLTVSEPARKPWDIHFIFPLTTMAQLLALGDRKLSTRNVNAGPADPAAEPFGDMPLPITAVLVDMRMAVSAIARIEPGAVLPVSVARSVPLRIGHTTIAHGTIGALDDRVAVQLTKAF
jgi:flagellar motor switch protein FliM